MYYYVGLGSCNKIYMIQANNKNLLNKGIVWNRFKTFSEAIKFYKDLIKSYGGQNE